MSCRHLRTGAAALACGLLLLVTGCGDEQTSELNAEMGPAAASPTPTLDPLAGAPTEGSCYRMNQVQLNAPTSSKRPLSDCYSNHTSYTYLVGLFPEGATSSDAQRADNQCQKHLTKATGLSKAELFGTVLDYVWFEPTTTQWTAGARWFRCDLVAKTDSSLVRLPNTSYLDTEFTDGVPDKYAKCIVSGPDTDGDGEQNAKYLTCDKPHEFRFAGAFTAPGKKYPGEDALKSLTDDRCADITQTSSWWATWPYKTHWDLGNHLLACYKQTTS